MEKIMRSIIYVDCAKEEYSIKLHYWLYHTHVPESISQFQPYVSKYAFYECLPVPEGGENYGTIHKQLTEHYWQANPMDASMAVKVFTETFPTDVLIWQKNLPESSAEQNFEGDDARATKVSGCNPFIFAFLPMWWEKDLKGKGRTIEDGANYRFNMTIGFPEGVDKAEGEKWLFEKVVPILQAAPECTRVLASAVKKDINGCVMDWVLEIWFENQSGWYKVMVDDMKALEKPSWAQQDAFPFLKPYHNVCSAAVADYTPSNNLANYRGYITMR